MEQTDSDNEKKNIIIDETFKITDDVLNFIPQESAELYKMVPLAKKDQTLFVGALNPSDIDVRDVLNFIATSQAIEYKLQQITQEEFNAVIQKYNEIGNVMTDTLYELEGEEDENVILGVREEDSTEAGFFQEEAPVIKLVRTILGQAVAKRASDIHIEPLEKQAIVRYRIDGILVEEIRFQRRVHDSLIARIKIEANLRLDERRRPQDGRFSSRIQNRPVDFRVASFPTANNAEKIILRVLDRGKGLLKLPDLGLRETDLEKVKKAIDRPYGLILATGPTGAGKTTTLYALIDLVDKATKNLISLEDPVEYRIEGINQSNIRPEIGYDFATGLRSVLRGDPDQILVGEIRDRETAQLAIQAALTGHLVYSTLHTNTALGAITRLINFGIDPFLLAPTLALVIGQRMVRRLDGEGKDLPISSSMHRKLEKKFSDLPQIHKSNIPDFTSFKEVVPTKTNPSGTKGRVGVFEVFEVDDEIQSIILDTHLESEIYTSARRNGYMTMVEDAIVKGLEGHIPISEVIKMANEDILDDLEEEQEAVPPVDVNKKVEHEQ